MSFVPVTPDEMSERLAEWARALWGADGRWVRRVVCVEDEGPRRTWVLFEGGRQVGHARGRQGPSGEWTWEASRRTREMLGLGLDDATGMAQTGAKEASR